MNAIKILRKIAEMKEIYFSHPTYQILYLQPRAHRVRRIKENVTDSMEAYVIQSEFHGIKVVPFDLSLCNKKDKTKISDLKLLFQELF